MKLIIFDCDGTVIDSQLGIVEAMSRALAAAGLPPAPRERILSGVGLSLPLTIERLLDGADKSTVTHIAASYRTAFRELRNDPAYQEPLYDGMLQLIQTLSGRNNHLLGMATGKSMRGVKSVFDRLKLQAHFATVQTADTHPSKPHPSMIETALRETGVEARHAVMIGDTTFDIEMARNAGVKAIGVAWGYHSTDSLLNSGALAVAKDATGLLQAIDQPL